MSTLEYTLFYVGYFLDFWGHPRVKTNQLPNIIAVDIEHNVAAIPGSGDVPVTFTHTRDVARFVAASLELPKWDRESYVIGDIGALVRRAWLTNLGIRREIRCQL